MRVWLWFALRLDGGFGWVCGLGLIWFAYLILDREAFLIYLFDLETL